MPQRAHRELPAALAPLVPHARRAWRALGLPPRTLWPYAIPGVPTALEARWRLRLRRAPVLTAGEHVARTGSRDIEEVVACQACGGDRVRPLFHPRSRRPGRWDYHVVSCAACGFLYRQPGVKPERLGELYEKGTYAQFLTGHYGKVRRRRYRHAMAQFGRLFGDGTGRRLLDYGCGAGLFLDVAHRRGFECYGVDLSPDAIEIARTKPSGANAFHGSPADVPEIAAGGFDVVTMWSVLAHLPRPVDDLRTLRGLLHDDGALLLLTVNADSLLLKAQGDRWNGFTPNHLVFSSPQTLPRLLREAGFGALVLPPFFGERFERGEVPMAAVFRRTMQRSVADGIRGNMLRGVAFADPDGPARWGLTKHVARLR